MFQRWIKVDGEKWDPGVSTQQQVTLTTMAFGEEEKKSCSVHPTKLSAVLFKLLLTELIQ